MNRRSLTAIIIGILLIAISWWLIDSRSNTVQINNTVPSSTINNDPSSVDKLSFTLENGEQWTSKKLNVTIKLKGTRTVHDPAPEMGGGDYTLVDVVITDNNKSKSVSFYSGRPDSIDLSSGKTIYVYPNKVHPDGSVDFSITEKVS